MARALTSNMKTKVQAKTLFPFVLLDLDFPDGELNLWTGIGQLTIPSGMGTPSGKTYEGGGDLLNIGRVNETQDLQAVSVQASLSGIPDSLVNDALDQEYQNRDARMFFGVFNDSGDIVDEPFQIFGGIMDFMEIQDDGESSTISVNLESRLADLQRTAALTFTKEDQEEQVDRLISEGVLSSGTVDKGFDFVAGLQDKPIRWQLEESTGNIQPQARNRRSQNGGEGSRPKQTPKRKPRGSGPRDVAEGGGVGPGGGGVGPGAPGGR